MSAFEAARERYAPLGEVYVGRSEAGREMLYIGEMCDTEMYDDYTEQRYHLERIPVQPREALALVEWIKTGPDELNRAMTATLPDDLGRTVGITEWYPGIGEGESNE